MPARFLRRHATLLAAVLALGALAGCRRITEPVNQHDLAGQWGPSEVTQPPSSLNFFTMYLEVRDTLVSGRGYWGDYPGPRGTVSVTGRVHGTAVDLDIAFSSDVPTLAARPPQHFTGDLVLPYELRGTLTENGASRPYGYYKAMRID